MVGDKRATKIAHNKMSKKNKSSKNVEQESATNSSWSRFSLTKKAAEAAFFDAERTHLKDDVTLARWLQFQKYRLLANWLHQQLNALGTALAHIAP